MRRFVRATCYPVTDLLARWNYGDPPAPDAVVVPLFYEELRRVARKRFAGQRSDHTLQLTAWLRKHVARAPE